MTLRRMGPRRRSAAARVGTVLVLALVPAEAAWVDRATPSFSAPTRITNVRFPVGNLTQVLQLGHEAGKPMRIEVTRLPRARTIEWGGRRVERTGRRG